jgi:carboxyl-terminal processing protease
MKTIKYLLVKSLIIILLILKSISPIQAVEVNYAAQYIKVWSLVKYYSPYQVDSKPNLDSVFQKHLKFILAKKSEVTFNRQVRLLLSYSNRLLIASANSESDPLRIEKIDSINGWIFSNPLLSDENKNRLIKLIHLKRDSISPFFRSGPARNVLFTNESRYLESYPVVEIRLIALAHYWSAVNYFFPYKDLIKCNWDSVLDCYCNEIIASKNDLEFHQSLLRLVTEIKDGHGLLDSFIIDKYYGYFQLPFEVSYIDDQLFITRIYKDALNKPYKFGDRILEVNHQSWDDFYRADSAFIHGSNEKRKKHLSSARFLRSHENSVKTVRLIRNDTVMEVSSSLIPISAFTNSKAIYFCQNAAYYVGDNYIYLDLSRLDSVEFEKTVLNNSRPNIIVDLREYPKLVIDQIADLFITQRIPHAAYSYPIVSIPGLFSDIEMINLKPRRLDRKVTYEKIFIMVDYSTLSMGEFTCMAFQALPNTITIGDQTAGADGNVTRIILPGNVTTRFSGLSIFYPDGRPTQQCGIKIDKYFYRTGIGISLGEDEGLNYILEQIEAKGKY